MSRVMRFAAATLSLLLAVAPCVRAVDAGTTIGCVGDASMASLMDAWIVALGEGTPAMRRGSVWRFVEGGSPMGALMFESADVAAMSRRPTALELAPYAHQFHGDMMKEPLLVHVADAKSGPVYLAMNKRPDSPLPPHVVRFVSFALGEKGREIAARPGFRPVAPAEAAVERAKVHGYLAALDPSLKPYHGPAQVTGTIRSVGSDGMKSLMDRWMEDFRRAQPGVRKGERWEHLGTLNGFHALLQGETDIAPMGRELWPAERAMYEATRGIAAPLEIRVARGGFNTPQRTTAQAIFVSEKNPIERISIAQLAAIFGANAAITKWGQLGLSGEWAERPIVVHSPPRIAPNAMSMQAMVLKGGPWRGDLHEGTIARTAQAIADDPASIGFGGLEEGGPGLKAIAVAAQDSGPYIELSADNASSGRYPLTRYLYIRLERKPGEAVAPAVREFLRFVLSREAQERILYSGYFPLNAHEAAEELAKLD